MKNPHAVGLGSIKSKRKAVSSRLNGLDQRPHFKKCRYFEKAYPYPLRHNEWQDKFVIGKTATGRDATYNPDYFCPTTGYYIEVATSKPNISEQGWKWQKALEGGLKLKVYWWEGQELFPGQF
jgi:hypothetical protein